MKLRKTKNRNKSHVIDMSDVNNFSQPFFVIVAIVMAFIYFSVLKVQPELQSGWKFFIFSGLMVAHVMLYWQSPLLIKSQKLEIIFLLVQSFIALSIIFLIEEFGYSYGIIGALIGITVGILRERRSLAFLFIILFLAAVSIIFQSSVKNIPPIPVIAVIPSILFVIVYVEMYSRQDDARQKAQRLVKEIENINLELSLYAEQVGDQTLKIERERMAYELHDTLGQGLAGLVLQLEAVKNHLENGRIKRAEEIVNNSLNRARITLGESRAVIDDLRVVDKNKGILWKTLKKMIADFNQNVNAEIELHNNQFDVESEFSWLLVENIKRIISEAIFNSLRHSNSSKVVVTISQFDNNIEFEVSDAGVGFNPAEKRKPGHYGLLGMEERSKKIKGKLKIISGVNKGTKIKLIIPSESAN